MVWYVGRGAGLVSERGAKGTRLCQQINSPQNKTLSVVDKVNVISGEAVLRVLVVISGKEALEGEVEVVEVVCGEEGGVVMLATSFEDIK